MWGAKAVDCSHPRIILRHILPNAIYFTLIMATLDMAVVLLAFALSFLGLGAPEGYACWGQMIEFSRGWIVGPQGEPLKYWYYGEPSWSLYLVLRLGLEFIGGCFQGYLRPKVEAR